MPWFNPKPDSEGLPGPDGRSGTNRPLLNGAGRQFWAAPAATAPVCQEVNRTS